MEMAFWCWVFTLTVIDQSFFEMVSVELCAWDVVKYAGMCHVFFIIFTHFFCFFSLDAIVAIYFPHVGSFWACWNTLLYFISHLSTKWHWKRSRSNHSSCLAQFGIWGNKNVLVLLHQLWSKVCTCGCWMSAQMLVLESRISLGSASRKVAQKQWWAFP